MLKVFFLTLRIVRKILKRIGRTVQQTEFEFNNDEWKKSTCACTKASANANWLQLQAAAILSSLLDTTRLGHDPGVNWFGSIRFGSRSRTMERGLPRLDLLPNRFPISLRVTIFPDIVVASPLSLFFSDLVLVV